MEIHGFLIVVVKHLRQYLPVLCVTVRVWYRCEVRLVDVFPTVSVFLSHTTATLREACIAYLTLVCQHLPACSLYCLYHMWVRCVRDTLIALAVIVGTYVEYGMVFTVVPTYQHIFFLCEREEIVGTFSLLRTSLNLCQQP